MSRSTACLMDADCLYELSSAQSIQVGTEKLNSGVVYTLAIWQERSRQRRELRELARSPELLRDTNLSFDDVRHESRKPFWRK